MFDDKDVIESYGYKERRPVLIPVVFSEKDLEYAKFFQNHFIDLFDKEPMNLLYKKCVVPNFLWRHRVKSLPKASSMISRDNKMMSKGYPTRYRRFHFEYHEYVNFKTVTFSLDPEIDIKQWVRIAANRFTQDLRKVYYQQQKAKKVSV